MMQHAFLIPRLTVLAGTIGSWRRCLGLPMVGLFALALAAPSLAHGSGIDSSRWEFDVYLDDKKIGKHSFDVTDMEGIKRVQSEANFEVKFLFITAYRYEHHAAERWSGNCLVELSASTNTNGERIQVSGERSDEGFVIGQGPMRAELPECVMTFAYWNPEFLDQPRLLNPQNGEYVDVHVQRLGDDTLDVQGQPVVATRYRLTARSVDLTLWYSSDDEWLALESIVNGGRIIRYESS